MTILERMQQGIVCYDGGMGTALIKQGMTSEDLSERFNVSNPEMVIGIHESFLNAGAGIILANTFGANRFHFEKDEMEAVIRAGIQCAKEAVARSGKEAYVALDIGSTGHLLPPMGMLPFEEAVEIFGEIVAIGAKAGADLVHIETMNDVYELKAAVVAAKENCDLPIFATAVFDENAHMLTGTSPESVVALLEGLGCSAIGINCGVGPKAAKKAIQIMSEYASVPLIAKPNAGLPRVVDGVTYFDVTPEVFAEEMKEILQIPGVNFVGGCCGTTTEHIRETAALIKQMPLIPQTEKQTALVSSYQAVVDCMDENVTISTAIDPAKSEDLLDDLQDGFVDSVIDLADEAMDEDADIINICVHADDVEEAARMKDAVMELQNINTTPFAIESEDAQVVEAGIRVYNGKALVNAGMADDEALAQIFAVAKKYGAVIHSQREDKEAVIACADACGFARKNLIFHGYEA